MPHTAVSEAASYSSVFLMPIALCPRRSSLVKIRMSLAHEIKGKYLHPISYTNMLKL